MTNINKPENRPKEDLTRVDPFREDEDTGGDAAPPLRRPTQTTQKPDMPGRAEQAPEGPGAAVTGTTPSS